MLRFVIRLARTMAILGGIVLTALVILVCISVLGRGANSFGHWDALEAALPWLSDAVIGTGVGPLPGDFEIVEAGIAFAIFAFLPLCQLHAGHATVDVFTAALPARTNAWLKAFWEVVLTAAMLLITWRLGAGLGDKYANGDITFILSFPQWWAYAASFVAAMAASVVALYCAYARVVEAAKGAGPLTGLREPRL